MNYADIFSMQASATSFLAAWGISLALLLAVIFIWSVIWKGLALWKAARKNHLIWFIVLLVVNTVGILEILYIFILSKMSLKKRQPAARRRR